MIIPKGQLNGEAVREAIKQEVERYLSLHVMGYKCYTSTVLDVLVKACTV